MKGDRITMQLDNGAILRLTEHEDGITIQGGGLNHLGALTVHPTGANSITVKVDS